MMLSFKLRNKNLKSWLCDYTNQAERGEPMKELGAPGFQSSTHGPGEGYHLGSPGNTLSDYWGRLSLMIWPLGNVNTMILFKFL